MPVSVLGSVNFYRNLPVILSFAGATEGRLHADVPKALKPA